MFFKNGPPPYQQNADLVPRRSNGALFIVRQNADFANCRNDRRFCFNGKMLILLFITMPDGFCSRNGVGTCPVHKFYTRIQSYLDAAFQDKTIASLMEDA